MRIRTGTAQPNTTCETSDASTGGLEGSRKGAARELWAKCLLLLGDDLVFDLVVGSLGNDFLPD
jgi:hypothetical protein